MQPLEDTSGSVPPKWLPGSKITAATLAVPGGAVMCWVGNHFFNLGIDVTTAGAFVGLLAAGVGYLVPEKWHHTVYEEPPTPKTKAKKPSIVNRPEGGEMNDAETRRSGHAAKVAPVPAVHSRGNGRGGSGDTDMGGNDVNSRGRTAGGGGSNWSYPDVWRGFSAQDEVVMTGPLARVFYMIVGAAVVYAVRTLIKRFMST